jgi:hypothetical protein
MLMFRSTHDALLAAERERTADALAAYRAEVARHDAALAELRALSAALAPKPAPTLPPKRVPGAVETAIAMRASGNTELTKYLAGWAKQQRLAGKSEDEIADLIVNGERSTDDADEDGVPG